MNTTISLAIIVKNAEATFDRCLSTFKEISDEIIVVDTGSTDKTLEIARKYTDKIYYFPWIDDFSAARNFSFEKCTKTHVLWVDSDDYILPEDIQKVKDLDFSDKEIIVCNYEYAHDEYGNSSCTVPRERFIRRKLFTDGARWEEEIHECFQLTGKLWISGVSTHHDKQHGTSERNLKILEKVVKKKDSSRNVYYLGKELFEFGRYDESIKYLDMFVARTDGFWEDVYHAHYKLAVIYFEKKDEHKFKYHIFESLKIEDRWAEPFYLLGLLYMNRGYYERAISYYKMCLNVKRSKDMLASYQPEYYTWLPSLNLALSYSLLGDLKSAYEYNEKVLEYRPNDSRALSNREILIKSLGTVPVKAEAPKPVPAQSGLLKNGTGKRLNLGCGGAPQAGYVNCDLFSGPGIDEVFSLESIPYETGTIEAILSQHSLEHVPYMQAEKALREWFRVLRPAGELILKIPEFEDCCRNYLATSPTDTASRKWYKNTIYGIQISQAGEPDEAQIHKWGYSEKEIIDLLESIGFILDYSVRYDGYRTPSVALRAVKPVSPLTFGWVCPQNWDAAQSRIRVLNVDRWLRSRGYRSRVIDDYSDAYDVLIVGKSFDEHTLSSVRSLKQRGKTVYSDVCESLFEFPYFKEILALCDKVICCSSTLAEMMRQVNQNVMVIEDAWE